MKKNGMLLVVLFLSLAELSFAADDELVIVEQEEDRAETSVFKVKNLDEMIEDSIPENDRNVELLLFKKIQFQARVEALPKERKTMYLQDVMRSFAFDPMPIVTDGMDIFSLQNNRLNVYMEKTVSDRAIAKLSPNQEITLYGYHVYNSKHGPGILIADFYVDERTLVQKVTDKFK